MPCWAMGADLTLPDWVLVLLFASVAGCAGWLQYTVSSGERGLNSFLMREKTDNPFYSKSYKKEPAPSAPAWLTNLKLPSFDYVEVYGSEPPSTGVDERAKKRAALYTDLNLAVEAEEYERAAELKARIDEV